MVTETNRQAVGRLVRKEPALSAAEIAARLGITRERVRQLLDALGYTWEPGRWKKRKPAAARRPVGRPPKENGR